MADMFPIGQGHGLAGKFGGLPDAYSNEEHSKIIILPIPFDQTTTYLHGTDKGPAAIIEASRHLELYDIETDSQVYLRGICTLPALESNYSQSMLKKAYAIVSDLIKQNKFVVTLGGEHTISFGPIQAYCEAFSSLTILQLDAHADLQLVYEGDPWSHACVMARVKELPGIEKIVAVGIRSLSAEEAPFIDPATTFFSHTLFDSDQWMDKVISQLKGPVYITIDLDVFDSSLMPSTGTPEPGGLFWPQTTKLLKKVAEKCHIVGFDVVELCPTPTNPAPDFLAAKLVYKLISYLFKEGNNK